MGSNLARGKIFTASIGSEGYSGSTEPIDAVNILPLARFEPTTSATPDTDATNCSGSADIDDD